MEAVDEVIGTLQFVSSSAPALYLNERLSQELFIAQAGAVGSFTLTAGRRVEGQAGPSIVRVGASKEGSTQINYDIGDPLTQALLLHSALGGTKALGVSLASPPGTFIECIGSVYLPPIAEPSTPPPPRWRRILDDESERQTGVMRVLGDSDAVLLPMLIDDQRGYAGSVVNRRWIRADTAASYLGAEQVAFGIVERVVEGLPFLTMVYMRPYF